MKYTIKEMADLLAVTTHKLRYYEKIGIIKPEVNEETGYRYFSVIDTRRFNLARLYRGMDFSVEECLELLSNKQTSEIIDSIQIQRQKLIDEVYFKQLCIDEMERYSNFLIGLPDLLNSVKEVELGPYIRVEFSNNEIITKNKVTLAIRDNIVEFAPLVRWVSRIPRSTLERTDGIHEYHYGVNMRLDNAIKLGLDVNSFEVLPGGKYLITVFKKNLNPDFGFETLTNMQKYIKEHNIDNYDYGLSSCIHSTVENGVMINYHYLAVKII
ncbi:MAG: MerR family transcriptional regulator, partial [Anaerorhabdus sp.]